MIRNLFLPILACLTFCLSGFAASDPSVGVVNFSQCVTDSKVGKKEQDSFESLKNQMTSLIEDTEKQIGEITKKLNDEDYMDGISPDAEEEMKNRFRVLNEEMSRYQSQYYQLMNQAQMQLIQKIGAIVQEASSEVAQKKKLTMVLNKEACFHHISALDITSLVIAEMDRVYDKQIAKTSGAQKTPKPHQKR